MYLKIIKHPKLLNLLFKAQASSAEIYLKDLLLKRFSRVDKNIYKINPENILYLDQVWKNFKTKFSKFLGVSPPPFSFLLIKNFSEIHNLKILRAGKIYLEKSLKDKINSVLKNNKIFYKIKSWGDLYELILPSTVDSKLEIFYKDIFWSGDKKFCFFCKTTWHESSECPALLNSEPRKTFQSVLNLHFKELSQLLWEGIYKENFSPDKLKYFYIRYFYLLPEFLKILFYRYENIETWSHLKLDMETPVRGGNLGLGLEYLIKGDLENAKREFSEIEKDFRANIGLALISILKKDLKNALYHIENALLQVKTPFLKSYLLFLKGSFYEYAGDSAIAEEFYKNAFENDFTCLPAFYNLNLSKYQKGTTLNEIFAYFNHPYLLYWSYLEPVFIKDQKELEKILYNKLLEKREEASQRLKDAEDRYHKIKVFFSELERKGYEERLAKIREDVHKKGLGLIESAAQRALELDLEFQGYVYKQIQNLRNEFEKIKNTYRILHSFWRKYPYKYENVFFGKELKNLSDLMQKIEVKLKRRDPSDVLPVLFSEINSCKKIIENLNIMKEDLIKKWNFRIRSANFLKNFTLSEIFLASFYIIFQYFPISESIKNILNFPSFLFISFIFLIIWALFSYFKYYDYE